MTESSIVVISAAAVSIVGTIAATIASIFAAYYSRQSTAQVKEVHTLVNGHAAVMSEKLAITSEELSIVAPTERNLRAAVVTRDIAEEYKKSGTKT